MFNTVDRVYQLINDNGMTMTKLCETCGLNRSTIANQRSRKGQLSLDTIELICQGLGISLSEFFAEDKGNERRDKGLCCS